MEHLTFSAKIQTIKHTDVYQRTQFYLRITGPGGETLINMRETEINKITKVLQEPTGPNEPNDLAQVQQEQKKHVIDDETWNKKYPQNEQDKTPKPEKTNK